MSVGRRLTKLVALAAVAWTWAGGASFAQGTSDKAPNYVEGIAQSAFGTATSQSYGAEIGYGLGPGVQAFIEAGRVTDTSGSGLNASAQLVASFLSQTQGIVGYSVRQPITFGLAGVRYQLPLAAGRLHPYVSGEGGIARVTRDVNFVIGGTNVTGTLPQFGVVLGSDLTGTSTKPMLGAGAGLALPVGRMLLLDVEYRFGRVLDGNQSVNINRAGVGLGIRF